MHMSVYDFVYNTAYVMYLNVIIAINLESNKKACIFVIYMYVSMCVLHVWTEDCFILFFIAFCLLISLKIFLFILHIDTLPNKAL